VIRILRVNIPIEAHDSICCGKVLCMYSMCQTTHFEISLVMVSNTISDTFRTVLQIHIFRGNMPIETHSAMSVLYVLNR
jgi:hypothetical protein